jgi:hypothetical protein
VTPATHLLLDIIADLFDPLLVLFALVAPLLRRPRLLRPAIVYYVCAATAVAMVYVLRAVDARYQIWASGGLDFSTHTAFAASLAVSLIALDRRWLAPALTTLALDFALMVVLRYHSVLDIVSSAPLAAAVAAFLYFAGNRQFSGDPRRERQAA